MKYGLLINVTLRNVLSMIVYDFLPYSLKEKPVVALLTVFS